MIVKRLSNSHILCHHGVEGQKWGVKHGPPYPLDSNVSTGERLKAQKSAYNDFRKELSNSKDSSNRHIDVKKYSENIKKYLRDDDINTLKKIDKEANDLFKKNKKLQSLQAKEDKLWDKYIKEYSEKNEHEYNKATNETFNEFIKWSKTEDGKKFQKLKREHADMRSIYVQGILGKYAGKKISVYTDKHYAERMGDIVDQAILNLSTDKINLNVNPSNVRNHYDRKGSRFMTS